MNGVLFLARLELLHDRGVLRESGLEAVVDELLDGQPVTLDHLVAIFGVGPISEIIAAAKAHPADRQLLSSRLEDVVETLRGAQDYGDGPVSQGAIVAACLKLTTIVRDALIPQDRRADRDPVAALDAAFPATTDRGRDVP